MDGPETADVEGSSLGCGDRASVDNLRLAVFHGTASHQHTARCTRVGMDQFDRDILRNPPGAVYRGGGRTGDGRSAVGPQPRRHDPLLKGSVDVFAQVDIGKHSTIARSQLMPTQQPAG